MTIKALTKGQVEEFRETGLLVFRHFYDIAEDIAPVRRGIYEVIGQVMRKNNFPDSRGSFAPDRFDDGYLDLIKVNRSWGGEVYDAIKQLPAFVRLVAHPAHSLIFSQLRESAIPGIAGGGSGIRIDNPYEDKYRALWHQEYPAQLRSLDGVVFWSPLVSITEELGPVQFCPGSHRGGPLPVLASDPDNAGRTGAYALTLSNESELLSKYKKISPLTNVGDLVLVDFLVLHASGHNRGNRSRWSMQFRYFNFAEPTGRSHGWKGSFAAGIDFRTLHPELCAKQ